MSHRHRRVRRTLPTILLALTGGFAGCAGIGRTAGGGARLTAAVESTPSGPAAHLSDDLLAGERVIAAYRGVEPPRALISAVAAGHVAGVVLFAPNTRSVSQTASAVTRLQRAALASPVHRRLLVLIDQEGGQVRRLPGPPDVSEKQIGASAHPVEGAAAAGVAAGRLLRAAGVNVNLAPVLDVYSQTGNFIDQYGRSYSANPHVAAAAGGAFITAQQAQGVAATAKHFPGLGTAATAQNTDERPVTLPVSLGRLRSADEVPYRTAIARGVELVMLSWAIYPALDPHEPAGFSSTIINGELRGRLGFGGVTITDGIDAGAIARLPLGTRAFRAARAGADLILGAAATPSQDSPTAAVQIESTLTGAIADGRLPRSQAIAAANRVLAPRSRLSPVSRRSS
ncbi:MAG TPA: glycoside hydrolase family 3 N-terminal domain-containing protein [Solirubrobacteraceae bacterium]|nr:glycoside hydrolase family 3 N-terminal domain-containing protein [Solirubrobacteraceae bacterium]